jgi:hypothetical protein
MDLLVLRADLFPFKEIPKLANQLKSISAIQETSPSVKVATYPSNKHSSKTLTYLPLGTWTEDGDHSRQSASSMITSISPL